jgi:acyl carrier protein
MMPTLMPEPLLNPLAALQAAFDEVLPEAKRTLACEDDLIDLGIGSIAALEIAGSLQTRYELEIPDTDLFELRTVGDFVAVIERRLQAARERL